jgi:4-hydroxy-tetrahydrodipicolinate synthase
MTAIPNGVYPTMVTPFTDDLQVDYGALPALLNWYETRGVAGIFAICASSEIAYLSFEERLLILRSLMRAKQPGTVMLASGHVETDPAAYIREAQAFAAEGIDAYVFISNRMVAEDEGDDVFLRRLEAAARAMGDIPLGLYECPSPYRRQLTPGVIKRLGSIGNFAFLKDTCCDLVQIKAKLAAAESTGLKIFNANTATLLDSLRAGCAGYSGVMGNFHPQLYAWLYVCYKENPALAERLQRFLDETFAMRCAYPADAKYYLHLEGLPIGWTCRSRNAKFTRGNQVQMERLWKLTQAFEQALLNGGNLSERQILCASA